MELKDLYFAYHLLPLPREKAKCSGISSLDDAELLALILNTGSKSENVMDLSYRIMFEKGNIKNLSQCDIDAIKTYGIKDAKAYRLMAVFEICKRLIACQNNAIDSIEEAIEQSCIKNMNLSYENGVVLFLSRKKELIERIVFTDKLVNKLKIPVDEIINKAEKLDCQFILLLHNHPSDIAYPSQEDDEALVKLNESLSRYSAILLDSIIITKDSYFSYRKAKRI